MVSMAAFAKAIDYVQRIANYYYGSGIDGYDVRLFGNTFREGKKQKGLMTMNLEEMLNIIPMGTYALSIFVQTIQGIPVYHDVGRRLDTTGNAPHELIDDAWEKSEPIMRISDNRFEFMGDDSFEMLVRWVKEAGIIKEDVPLAPLSSIISSIEDEIQKGHIRNVYALRLGMVAIYK